MATALALSLFRPVADAAPRESQPSQVQIKLDPRVRRRSGESFVAQLDAQQTAVLTLDPGLDEHLGSLLRRYQVPRAGVVAIEPATGRLLAYVSHSSDPKARADYALDASAPSASVFKLITAAALLEHGMRPTTHTCYHGGQSGLTSHELTDNAKLDTACVSLSTALGFSVNAVFGKRALKHLDAPTLLRYASAFGFGQRLPFDTETEVSAIDVPSERVEFARTAAGFWHSQMSPLHAALIAATIANRGRMMRPHLIDRVLDARGQVRERVRPRLFREVLGRHTAELLGEMMQTTVVRGTARKTFFDQRGRAFLPGVSVAGKTGTLSEEQPYRGYTWWVGFAPADKPAIAVAALVVNSPKWRIKAPLVAREALRYYLKEGAGARAGASSFIRTSSAWRARSPR